VRNASVSSRICSLGALRNECVGKLCSVVLPSNPDGPAAVASHEEWLLKHFPSTAITITPIIASDNYTGVIF